MLPVKKYFCICLCMAVLTISLNGCTVTKSNNYVTDYLKADVPIIYPQFSIFPQKESLSNTIVNEYQSITVSSLVFDDICFWLSCTYSDSQFCNEIERIQANQAEYREDIFQFPAYVMLYTGNYYEYALLEPQKNTIIYVYAQTADFDIFKSFPTEYYPNTNVEIDICHYKTD